MSRTTMLRKQHDFILDLAGEIDKVLDQLVTEIDVARLQKLLARFDNILTIHLQSEDTFLYPAMQASSNQEASETATRFHEEMGGLLGVYAKFSLRWASAKAIFEQQPLFRQEWNDLCAALGNRIERENGELYPLADAMGPDAERKSA